MRRSPFVRILGALALISSEASIGGLSHGLGLVPRSQRSGLVKRRRVQAPATATDRIAQVTIGAYVAQVARPSLAALGARSTTLVGGSLLRCSVSLSRSDAGLVGRPGTADRIVGRGGVADLSLVSIVSGHMLGRGRLPGGRGERNAPRLWTCADRGREPQWLHGLASLERAAPAHGNERMSDSSPL